MCFACYAFLVDEIRPTFRDVTRQAVQEQITIAALARFRTRGFHATTVAEISSDVGMSARTFFRYFASKDDILLQAVQHFRRRFLSRLEPALRSQNLWFALRTALEDALLECRSPTLSARDLEIQAIISQTPELLARQLQILGGMQAEVADMSGKLDTSGQISDWTTVHAVAGAAFACLHAAQLDLSLDADVERVIVNLHDLMRALTPQVLA